MPDEKPPGPSGQDYLRLGQDGDTVRGHGQARPAHNYEFLTQAPAAPAPARASASGLGSGSGSGGSPSEPAPPAYGDYVTTQSSILGGGVTASPDRMSSPPPYSPGGNVQVADAANSLLPQRGESAPSAGRPAGGNGSGTGDRPARTM
ncbi:hypothetical protein ACFRKD_22520 [Streptomyces niveus]|uniref:hypothetical protein n=1 Tax=Streptomyces niveus TaxID=193462 RepID=UPI0036CA8C9E